MVDAGTFIGSDRTAYGPFNAVKEPTVSNDGSKISFFAEDNAGWHFHQGKLGAAFDQTFGLRPGSGRSSHYGFDEKQTATVIDDQVFHKIKAEPISGKHTTSLVTKTMAGVVVNMKRSQSL